MLYKLRYLNVNNVEVAKIQYPYEEKKIPLQMLSFIGFIIAHGRMQDMYAFLISFQSSDLCKIDATYIFRISEIFRKYFREKIIYEINVNKINLCKGVNTRYFKIDKIINKISCSLFPRHNFC